MADSRTQPVWPASPLERLITTFDQALRTVCARAEAQRPAPGEPATGADLPAEAKREAARLMRVNHAGEVCAQALYQGQALTARNSDVRSELQRASDEERDHLAWCEQRLDELGGSKSVLNPFWYGASFAMGAASGLLGDRWNLAFLAETERQVEGHLKGHLDRLPQDDQRSRAIIEQMKADEAGHAQTAVRHGAAEMPAPLKAAMKFTSKLMTATAYWV